MVRCATLPRVIAPRDPPLIWLRMRMEKIVVGGLSPDLLTPLQKANNRNSSLSVMSPSELQADKEVALAAVVSSPKSIG